MLHSWFTRIALMGEVDVTADKERYTLRPPTLDLLTLAQFLQWFRVPNRGEEEAVIRQATPIALIKAEDSPWPPLHCTILPATLTLEDGTVMRRMRQPRVLHVSPSTAYSTILLCKVTQLFFI